MSSKYNNKIGITSGRKLPIPKPLDDKTVFDSLIGIQDSLSDPTGMEGVDWYDSLVIYVSEFHMQYAWRNAVGDVATPGAAPVPNPHIDYTSGLLPTPHQYPTLIDTDIRSEHLYNFFPVGGAGGCACEFCSDLPTTATNLQGFPVGTTFEECVSVQDMWKTLLYPYMPPVISLTAVGDKGELPGYYEKGYEIEMITLTATTTKKSEDIDLVEMFKNGSDIYGNATPNPGGGMDVHVDGTPAAGQPYPVLDVSYHATVRDTPTATTVLSNTQDFKFVYPFYVGSWPDPVAFPIESDIQAMTKLITPKQDNNWTFNFTQERYVYAYPASYGNLFEIYDTNKFSTLPGDWDIVYYNLTMLDGAVVPYQAYVFKLLTTAVNFINYFHFSTNTP